MTFSMIHTKIRSKTRTKLMNLQPPIVAHSPVRSLAFAALPPGLSAAVRPEDPGAPRPEDYKAHPGKPDILLPIRWQNPDGDFTRDEILQIACRTGGLFYLSRELGMARFLKLLGSPGFLPELKLTVARTRKKKRWLAKELAKCMVRNPNHDPLPMAFKGFYASQEQDPGTWVNRHDVVHGILAKLRPKIMGRGQHAVDGIAGHSSRVTPFFFPEKPVSRARQYKGEYLDELYAATAEWILFPTPHSLYRLLSYIHYSRREFEHPIRDVLALHRELKTELKAIGMAPIREAASLKRSGQKPDQKTASFTGGFWQKWTRRPALPDPPEIAS